MAMINFDCPECGHNLEVDERGAGFIVKCPACDNPLQVPELPKSHRIRKIVIAGSTLLAILLLFGTNVLLWRQARSLQRQLADQQAALQDFGVQAQTLSLQQEGEIARLRQSVQEARRSSNADLAQAALNTLDFLESLSRELETTSRSYLDNNASARTALLRDHMNGVVEAAKNSLPAAPVITDVGPGRGIQGRQIVFPVLPNPDGQPLRENAEVTGIDEDKISFRFAEGGATYALTELHPGVAAYLPVDRLLALPRRQWANEVIRIHQMKSARRDQQIAEMRRAIEAHLPPE